jgi:hypothetical protein
MAKKPSSGLTRAREVLRVEANAIRALVSRLDGKFDTSYFGM